MTSPSWSCLFIGGTSSTGKSTLAQTLVWHFEARYIDLDLFWIVLQRAVPAEHAPDLHLFDDDAVWSLPVEELVERYLRVAAYICGAIEPVVAHHDIIGAPVVIAGAWLLPSFVTQGVFAGRRVGGVRSLFLHESSSREIESRILARPKPWLRDQSPEIARSHVLTQLEYGLEVCRRAEDLSLPVLASRPFGTLFDRALAAPE